MTIAFDYMNPRQRQEWDRCMEMNLPYSAGRIAWMAQIEHEDNIKNGRNCDCGVCLAQPTSRREQK